MKLYYLGKRTPTYFNVLTCLHWTWKMWEEKWLVKFTFKSNGDFSKHPIEFDWQHVCWLEFERIGRFSFAPKWGWWLNNGFPLFHSFLVGIVLLMCRHARLFQGALLSLPHFSCALDYDYNISTVTALLCLYSVRALLFNDFKITNLSSLEVMWWFLYVCIVFKHNALRTYVFLPKIIWPSQICTWRPFLYDILPIPNAHQTAKHWDWFSWLESQNIETLNSTVCAQSK